VTPTLRASPADWPEGRPTAPPPEGEAHIWFARLDPPEEIVAACRAVLSPAERFLAGRKVTDELKRRAIVSRGLLRRALGDALGREAADVPLALGEKGKPHLADRADSARLDFNLSHSGDLWLLALVAAGPVGVDIEVPRDETDWDALTERYFSDAERAAFAALPAEERRTAFFRIWTQKEALLKAHGSGLATPLDAFDVEVDPQREVAIHAIRIPDAARESWWVAEVPGLGAPAALAGRGPRPTLRSATYAP
jgi:4'-phosphopantetheinyl transferase